MKKFGDSAIHDHGFQFYLTLGIKNYINKQVEIIKILDRCANTHKKWKGKEWYTSKTKAPAYGFIYDIPDELTLGQCNKLLSHHRQIYQSLIHISEEALNDAKNNSKTDGEQFRPFYEDEERMHVLVEDKEG